MKVRGLNRAVLISGKKVPGPIHSAVVELEYLVLIELSLIVAKEYTVLTLSHMASKVARTIWHGGWRDTPKKTTLAIVKTILGASKPPAMP
jgi:hypothetical protein